MTIVQYAESVGVKRQTIYGRLRDNKIAVKTITDGGGNITERGMAILDSLYGKTNSIHTLDRTKKLQDIQDELDNTKGRLKEALAQLAAQQEANTALQARIDRMNDDNAELKARIAEIKGEKDNWMRQAMLLADKLPKALPDETNKAAEQKTQTEPKEKRTGFLNKFFGRKDK